MPKISVAHTSTAAPADAVDKIKTFFETDKDLKKMDPDIKCQFSDLTAKVKGSQFKADVSVKASGQGSEVSVVIDLPLLLTPFKGKIEETIRKKLSKYLA